ncbi:hypothetical protein VTJ04DRAFT_4496 [Mycothermus thermophilus]|uniref:uncharacterized protein n=1 Tax=Humicola insolens TaxID=85995 RepID=UPI0037432ADE
MILSGKHMSSKAIWWLHVHLWVEAKQRKSFFIPTPSGSLSHFLLSSSLSCGVNENHMGLGGIWCLLYSWRRVWTLKHSKHWVMG